MLTMQYFLLYILRYLMFAIVCAYMLYHFVNIQKVVADLTIWLFVLFSKYNHVQKVL